MSLSGLVVTGRDRAHKYLVEEFVDSPQPSPAEAKNLERIEAILRDGVIYHCGPVVREQEAGYSFVAAGPTTSMREEGVQDEVIERFGLRAVIGKGGMGERTLSALQKNGAVYLHAVGGAATYLARAVEEVVGVLHLDFGVPEAMWEIRVRGFPAIVTMDSTGGSLHREVDAHSELELRRLLEGIG